MLIDKISENNLFKIIKKYRIRNNLHHIYLYARARARIYLYFLKKLKKIKVIF